MPRCFVIASGPSLEGFDFHRLDNEVTIGINYIYKYYTPTILHWIDPHVYHDNKKAIDEVDSVKVTKTEATTNTYDVHGLPLAIQFNGRASLSMGLYHRHLGGMTGMSLAIGLGFAPIYLLGMDCTFKNGLGHFYSKDFLHKGDKRQKTFEQSVRRFNEFKGWPDIYNCSPISLLTIFPKVNIDEVLAQDTPKIDQDQIKLRIRKALREKEPIW